MLLPPVNAKPLHLTGAAAAVGGNCGFRVALDRDGIASFCQRLFELLSAPVQPGPDGGRVERHFLRDLRHRLTVVIVAEEDLAPGLRHICAGDPFALLRATPARQGFTFPGRMRFALNRSVQNNVDRYFFGVGYGQGGCDDMGNDSAHIDGVLPIILMDAGVWFQLFGWREVFCTTDVKFGAKVEVEWLRAGKDSGIIVERVKYTPRARALVAGGGLPLGRLKIKGAGEAKQGGKTPWQLSL